MKKLYLVRHAKSSRDDSSLEDQERPLNERGKKDAPKMGKRLKDHHVFPDLILSSPAVRTISTCEEISRNLGYPVDRIKQDKRLYLAGLNDLFNVLKELNESVFTVMLFGHNPGLTEFANRLLKDDIENIPTCGVVAGELTIEKWADLKWGCGKHLFFDFPKKLK